MAAGVANGIVPRFCFVYVYVFLSSSHCTLNGILKTRLYVAHEAIFLMLTILSAPSQHIRTKVNLLQFFRAFWTFGINYWNGGFPETNIPKFKWHKNMYPILSYRIIFLSHFLVGIISPRKKRCFNPAIGKSIRMRCIPTKKVQELAHRGMRIIVLCAPPSAASMGSGLHHGMDVGGGSGGNEDAAICADVRGWHWGILWVTSIHSSTFPTVPGHIDPFFHTQVLIVSVPAQPTLLIPLNERTAQLLMPKQTMGRKVEN